MSKKKNKSGFSLVEVMVAILLLAVLAFGGSAVMYQTGGSIQRQQNKREAIVAASDIMESYWNTTYASLAVDASNSPESITTNVNGQTMSALSTVVLDDDGDGGNYYEINVSVTYLTGDTVDVVSRRYEKGLSKARAN